MIVLFIMIGKILASLVFLLGIVSASSVTCVIVDDKVLVDVLLTDGADVILPEEHSLLENNGERVSFISRDWIRKNGEWIFVLPVVVTGGYDLEVVLPSGYVLSDGLVYPRGYNIGSDGKSIILEWEDISEEVIVFYEGNESSYAWVFVLVVLLIGAGFLLHAFEKRKFSLELDRLKEENRAKKRVVRKDNITRNLFGNEKRIVELLVERKRCWMKEIVSELGLSKVMVTRKIRSLKEKGIVSAEKMGREMRIELVKN